MYIKIDLFIKNLINKMLEYETKHADQIKRPLSVYHA